APRLPLPAPVGRPRPARPRQQRDVRRLPPGGAGRPVPHARPGQSRRRPRRGSRGGAARGDLRVVADVPPGAGLDRVLGHRGARGELHDGLRGLRRGRGRRAAGLPARPHRADAVRLRQRAPQAAPRRRARRPRAAAGARRPGASGPAGRTAGGARRSLPGARALLRRRRLRPRQQREVLRVLPGGPDPPADGAARARRRRRSPPRGRADGRRLPPADPVPGGALRLPDLDLPRRPDLGGLRVRRARRRGGARTGARRRRVHGRRDGPPDPGAGRLPAGDGRL
ncbi:MAG: Butyryl-CoA dehydrogenase, partial [uncultured Nocardioides sp.]